MLCGLQCKSGRSSILEKDYKRHAQWTYMSQGQHTMCTRVTDNQSSVNYHGAAWTSPSPIGSDISADADGVYPGNMNILVDISYMLSRMLGKQMSMTETYRVTGITIGLKNIDPGLDDNDRGLFLYGYCQWYSPSKHRIDAVQACRRIEQASEEAQIDSDSLWMSTSNTYQGFRFNWDADNQVRSDTGAGAVAGWNPATGENNWNLSDMVALYGAHIDPVTPKGRQLFESKLGGGSNMRFGVAMVNAMHLDGAFTTVQLQENPTVNDFHWKAESGRHIDVMGGLINIEVQGSNTTPNGDVSPDDYDVVVGIQVEGWSSW